MGWLLTSETAVKPYFCSGHLPDSSTRYAGEIWVCDTHSEFYQVTNHGTLERIPKTPRGIARTHCGRGVCLLGLKVLAITKKEKT